MKKKYIYIIFFVIILNTVIMHVNVSSFPNLLQGGFFSSITSKLVWCFLFDVLCLFFALKTNIIFDMPYEILMNHKLVWDLAKNDFKVRFVGSYLGVFWAFINPLVTIILYWIVFQFAFKSTTTNGYPFVLWLVAGLVPWFLIQDAIMNGTNALLEYSYLVKKVVFRISVLPAVKVISACFIHSVFMIVTLLIYIFMGYFPSIYILQIIYYFIATIIYTLAITYATSALVLFIRDLGQFISVFMQVFMWATPILWDIKIVPIKLQWIFKLNPAYYIIEGYRDSLLFKISIFQHMGNTLYFWTVILFLLIIGSTIFKKLRPNFADVL